MRQAFVELQGWEAMNPDSKRLGMGNVYTSGGGMKGILGGSQHKEEVNLKWLWKSHLLGIILKAFYVVSVLILTTM